MYSRIRGIRPTFSGVPPQRQQPLKRRLLLHLYLCLLFASFACLVLSALKFPFRTLLFLKSSSSEYLSLQCVASMIGILLMSQVAIPLVIVSEQPGRTVIDRIARRVRKRLRTVEDIGSAIVSESSGVNRKARSLVKLFVHRLAHPFRSVATGLRLADSRITRSVLRLVTDRFARPFRSVATGITGFLHPEYTICRSACFGRGPPRVLIPVV